MLILTKKGDTGKNLFENYEELCKHITDEENSKLRKSHPESWQSCWSFQVLWPERVANLINTLKKTYDEKMLYEAWHRQLPLVEICEGDYEKVHQVIVEANVNIEALREDWCKDYCKAHGMVVTKSEQYFKTEGEQ